MNKIFNHVSNQQNSLLFIFFNFFRYTDILHCFIFMNGLGFNMQEFKDLLLQCIKLEMGHFLQPLNTFNR